MQHRITKTQYDYLCSNGHSLICSKKYMRPGTIYDYKTIGSLDTARIPTSFPRSYWFQQQLYAWIMRKLGYKVDYLTLVYITRSNTGRISEKTGKPLQDYPSECHLLTEPVTAESQAIIEGLVHLIAESVQLFQSNPEYRHLLMQDYRYKVTQWI